MSDSVNVVVFTRDLRVNDNPVLAAAAAANRIVPMFVFDEDIARGFPTGPRERFLSEALRDLDSQLRRLGARLVIRRGDFVEQICRVAAEVDAAEVHIATDVSGFAQHRQRRLATALAGIRRELRCHDAVHTVLAPGAVTPSGSGQDKDHFAVFTPYYRRWGDVGKRPVTTVPPKLSTPRVWSGELPETPAKGPAAFATGGETAGRHAADEWLAAGIDDYADRGDNLGSDATSRLSPYLHFGCLSPRELSERAGDSDGAAAFVRQLAWRDFHHQVLAARPRCAQDDYRPHGDRWRDDDDAAQAWAEGMTGIPVVDAGMRQLRAEGWMHNRARLITASFLTKTLYIDWRIGAEHFFRLLVDGDVANNCMNWQWAAGTGTDTRPNRVLNPVRQAERYDPTGDYVRRYVPELADLNDPRNVHLPWRLGEHDMRRRGYPPPIVDLDEARERFRRQRAFNPGS